MCMSVLATSSDTMDTSNLLPEAEYLAWIGLFGSDYGQDVEALHVVEDLFDNLSVISSECYQQCDVEADICTYF